MFYFFNTFILYLTDRDRVWAGEGQREREGDTECEAGSRLWAVSTEPDAGLELTNCEIMTWAEVGRLTDWTTQAPRQLFLKKQKTKKKQSAKSHTDLNTITSHMVNTK